MSVLILKVVAVNLEQAKTITRADDVAVLARWQRADVFLVSALPYRKCTALFDFIVAELQTRVPLCPHRLGPACTLLKNHRDQLLVFALQLDEDLAKLAAAFAVPMAIVRDLLDLQTLDKRQPWRWQKKAALRARLRGRCHEIEQAVRALAGQVVRASSIIENINSRLRSYFFPASGNRLGLSGVAAVFPQSSPFSA